MCLWPKLWEKVSGSRYEFHHPCYTKIAPETPKNPWWKSFWVAWISVWIVIPFLIFQCMHSYAMENRKETLASMCDARSRMLQDQFNVSMNHVQAMSILISTFHHAMNPSVIDQKTFAQYTERTAFERPLTSGVAYAVRVLASEREEFEKQQGWKIKRMDAIEDNPVHKDDYCTEALEASPPQEEYAPVIFAQETVSHVVSVDMLSGKEDRENVLRARQSAKGVLTAPFRLLKTNRLGVILTFAVYKTDLPLNTTPEERIKATYGYLGGIFDIESLVEKLLQQLASKEDILVNVYDITNKSQPISMYGSNVSIDNLEYVSPLNFGDPSRQHEMRCRFQEKPPMPWLALSIAISVHVIGLLAGHIINSTRNRIAKVEDDYNEMMGLKKRAEAADVAKSRFLATVSHEIRTPMNGVLGMLHMLMDTDLDVTQQEYVRTAQASGKALVSIINEVLDQAKIESGKLELEMVRFDLRSIIDDVVLLFVEKSRDKGIELAVFISENVPEKLVGDPGRFRQIITNLMGNSIKFTEKGHIFVTVHLVEELSNFEDHLELSSSLSGFPVAERRRSWANFTENESVPDDAFRIVVSVEDTGSGIPFDAQARVFTPFMQVGPSISRMHGGTGIGLSISKCLVNLMNGEIGFVSEPEIGSTFTFSVVFSKCDETPKEKMSSEFEGMVGYLIDPRPVRAKVSKYHIQRLGIDVECFADLNLCLSTVGTETPLAHMVFVEHEVWQTDLSISSLLVTKLRKTTGTGPNLFVLASSKMGSTGSGCLAPNVITKPLKAGLLAASLRRAMGMKNKDSSNKEASNASLHNYLIDRKILIVDDNEVNLKVAAGALRKYGADVVHAKSGEEAIKFLKPPHSFDACFMDIQMPEMDGFEATRRIRAMEKEGGDTGKRCVPILAMTADVFNATHDECLKYGMDGYVSKPFEAEQLYQEVSLLFPPKT